ncbi:MAG: hypothetical protein ACI94Y_001805 [Maribacter sp.]|jgi:hypothetical protein
MRNRKTGFGLMGIAIQIMVRAVAIGMIIVTIGIIGIISIPFVISMLGIWIVWNITRVFFEKKDDRRFEMIEY